MKRLALLLSFTLVAACGGGGGDGPKEIALDGSWLGTFTSQGIDTRMTFDPLTEDLDGNLSGSGCVGPATSPNLICFAIGGVRTGTSLAMAITPVGFQAAVYTAELTDVNTMNGRLDGSGYANEEVVMVRQK